MAERPEWGRGKLGGCSLKELFEKEQELTKMYRVRSFEVCVCVYMWVVGVSGRPASLLSWPWKSSQAGSV